MFVSAVTINTANGFKSEGVYTSTNGGLNWFMLPFQDSLNFYSIDFINETTGWISARIPNPMITEDSAMFIFKTSDGGLTWLNQFSFYNQFSP